MATRHKEFGRDKTMPPESFHQVFSIMELAGTIFLELPAQQIMVNVQRVCRQWKALVDGSLLLQQALFLKPTTAEPMTWVEIKNGRRYWESSELSTFLTHSGRGNFIAEHPLVTLITTVKTHLLDSRAMNRESASWRKMLLTQPPIDACKVFGLGTVHGERYVVGEVNGDVKVGVKADKALSTSSWSKKSWQEVRIPGWYSWQDCSWDTMSAKDFLEWVKVDLRKVKEE